VVELHRLVMESGGAVSILNLSALESALAQPLMMFGEEDLYPKAGHQNQQRRTEKWLRRKTF
jgi:hypothetical protein